MLRMILNVLGLAALAYVALCALLFLSQRSLIYFPQPAAPVPGASLVTVRATDAQVRATAFVRTGPKALIYFGGNAEDAGQNLPSLRAAFPEHALYAMNYRSFGPSSGQPSETALVADGLALFDLTRAQHSAVTVMGRSLGTGVAVQIAAAREVQRLILVTPYDSLLGLAQQHYPIIPVRWLLRDPFDSGQHAPRITVPTLILAAESDEVIPAASTALLHSRFKSGVAVMKVVPGTGHNTISESALYWGWLGEFQ